MRSTPVSRVLALQDQPVSVDTFSKCVFPGIYQLNHHTTEGGYLSYWYIISLEKKAKKQKCPNGRERDVAPWLERSLMVRWVVGSILHGKPIETFLNPASAARLV